MIDFTYDFVQLGDGVTEPSRSAPVDVSGLSSGVKSIASCGSLWYHSCAVMCTGTVKCWGSNEFGQVMTFQYNGHMHLCACADCLRPHSVFRGSLETALQHRQIYQFE